MSAIDPTLGQIVSTEVNTPPRGSSLLVTTIKWAAITAIAAKIFMMFSESAGISAGAVPAVFSTAVTVLKAGLITWGATILLLLAITILALRILAPHFIRLLNHMG